MAQSRARLRGARAPSCPATRRAARPAPVTLILKTTSLRPRPALYCPESPRISRNSGLQRRFAPWLTSYDCKQSSNRDSLSLGSKACLADWILARISAPLAFQRYGFGDTSSERLAVNRASGPENTRAEFGDNLGPRVHVVRQSASQPTLSIGEGARRNRGWPGRIRTSTAGSKGTCPTDRQPAISRYRQDATGYRIPGSPTAAAPP